MSTVTTPAQDEQPPVSEELVLGPRPARALPRWVPVVALVLGVLILAGAATWRFWPRSIAPLTLVELQDTYAGMVRSDGTNDASVMTRQTVTEDPLGVTPAACAPLVEATAANKFPAAAIDGVGTYWVGQGSTVSLFTLRFDDDVQALTERTRILTALDACADRQVFVRRSLTGGARPWQATVGRTPVGTGSDDQVGYTLVGSDGVMAVQLMPYLNTLTWQSRYETGSQSYSTLAADQLMQSLRSQLDTVVDARPPR